jgi:hypothetical protein
VQLQMRVAVFAYMGFHQYPATLIIPNYDSVVMLLRHCVVWLKSLELEVLYMLRLMTLLLLFCDVTHCVDKYTCLWRHLAGVSHGVSLLECLVELTLVARSALKLVAL